MPAFILPFLKGLLPFLWRYKFVILALLIVGLVWWQHEKIQKMAVYQTALKQANAAYVSTLRTVRDSAARQIAALEKESADKTVRDNATAQIIKGVEQNDEQVTCPVPGFVRDAFERM